MGKFKSCKLDSLHQSEIWKIVASPNESEAKIINQNPLNQMKLINRRIHTTYLFYKLNQNEEDDFKKKIEETDTYKNNIEYQSKNYLLHGIILKSIYIETRYNEHGLIITLLFNEKEKNLLKFTETSNILSKVHKPEKVNPYMNDKIIKNQILYTIEKTYDKNTMKKFFIINGLSIEYNSYLRVKESVLPESRTTDLKSMNRARENVLLKSTISVYRSIIKLEISIELGVSFDDETKARLRGFMKKLNKNNFKGRFLLDQKIKYVLSFYALQVTKYNGSVFAILQDILVKEVHPNIENFIIVVNNQPENVQIKSNVHSDTKCEIFLNEPQLYENKIIVQRFLEEVKSTFFQSRFSSKLIRFSDSRMICSIKANTSRLDRAYSPNELYDAFDELSDMLAKFYLSFKEVPDILMYFRVLEEKPIFMFDVPLSDLIEIHPRPKDSEEKFNSFRERIIEEFMTENEVNYYREKKKYKKNSDQEFNENMAKKCLKRKSKKVIHDSISRFSEEILRKSSSQVLDQRDLSSNNTQCVVLNTCTANIRLQLNKPLCLPCVMKIMGSLMASGNEIALFYKSFKETLEERIRRICPQEFKEVVIECLGIIEFIQMKNTLVGSFDINCFGYQSNKLKVLLKAPDEIEEEFLAPEVKLGRFSDSSVVYSLGKIVKRCTLINQQLDSVEWTQRFVNLCTQEVIFKRASLRSLKKLLEQ